MPTCFGQDHSLVVARTEELASEGGVEGKSGTKYIPLPPPVITTTRPLAEKRLEGVIGAWTSIIESPTADVVAW